MITVLQQRVWESLSRIPEGKVTTYALIARHLHTKAVRAVASAVGKNPDAPQVPCHRVVLSSGHLGEYSGPGGKTKKASLLRAEGVQITHDRIAAFADVLYTY